MSVISKLNTPIQSSAVFVLDIKSLNSLKIIIFQKLSLKKCTPTLIQDSLNMPKVILSVNVKQHVKFEIATYAKQSPIQLFEQFPARIY